MQDQAVTTETDTTAPAMPSTPDLIAASDSGGSTSDNITRITSPTVAGQAEAGSTVTLYEGQTALGTAVADTAGAWSIAASALADGVHYLSASATDAAGNVSVRSAELALTIDTAGPAAPTGLDLRAAVDRGLSSSDNYTDVSRLQIGGYGEAGSTVTLYEGAVALGSAVVNAAGAWTVYTRAMWLGTHNITAIATDTAGNNSAASEAITVITRAELAAPSKPLLAPGSDTGRSASDNLTNAASQSFVGTTVAGATVTLFDGTKAVGTQTADGNGQWSITTALAHGNHSLKAMATDPEGFSSAYSAVLNVTVDAAPPAAPVSNGITAGADSGVSAGDNVTSVTTPIWTGTAEANALVVLTEGATMLGSAIADASGAWSITSATLVDGVHALTLTATDAAGNASAVQQLAPVTIDTVNLTPAAPTLAAQSDDGVSSTDGITTVTTPVFTGSAESGSTVTLYEGGTVLGSAIANGPSSGGNSTWSIAVGTPLGVGLHHLTVVSRDIAGNVSGASGATTIDIRSLAPLAPSAPDLAAASDSGISNADNITSVAQPVFVGTAEAGSSVTLYEGAAVRGTGVADSAGAWSITANAPFAQGLHTLTATAANGIGVSPASVTFSFTVDSSAPAAVPALDLSTAQDSGVSNTDNLTNVTAPTFSGSAEAGATVSLYSGVTLVGSSLVNAAGQWTVAPSFSLPDGLHGFAVIVTDAAGNASAPSAPLSVTVDASVLPPSPPDMAATSDKGTSTTDNITNITTPVFTGTAEAGSTVTLYDGATAVGSAVTVAAGTWSITSAPLALGIHQITAVVTDKAGNVSAPSGPLPVEITIVPPQPGAPDLVDASDSGNLNTDNRTNVTSPTFTGTALPNSTVTLFVGGSTAGTGQADASGMWTITSKALTSGTYSVMVRANNTIGTSAFSPTMQVVVDTSVNAPANFDLTAASDSGTVLTDNYTSVINPVFTGLAEAGATVQLVEGGHVWGTTVAGSNGAWSITADTMGDGVHSLNAIATDIAGNVSAPSVALAVTVDTTPPAPSEMLDLTTDTGGSNTDNVTQEMAFRGVVEGNSRVTLYANGVEVATATTGTTGIWSSTYAPTADGIYSMSATVTDRAGNISAMSPELLVTLDRVGPQKPVINLAASSDTGRSDSDWHTNDVTPTFWGYTDPGARVRLADGPSGIDSASGAFHFVTADSTGYWEWTGSMKTGNLQAQVTDVAGNKSPLGQTINIYIDAVAPKIYDYNFTSTDSGNGSDFITNVTAPTFLAHLRNPSGFGEDWVEIWEGETLLATATKYFSGWQGDVAVASTRAYLPVLSEGAHHLTIKAVDQAGNVGTVIYQTAVIDTVAIGTTPDMLATSDTGSSNTDNITRSARPTFTGVSEPGAYIKLYDGATVIGVATADSDGGWVITPPSNLALGDHQIYAMVKDVAANTMTTGFIIVSIVATDTVGPVVLDLDGNGIELLAASDERTTFDVNGDAVADHTAWVGAGDGLLVFDANSDSAASGYSEVVLSAHGPAGASDLESLAFAFDLNKDGVFDNNDAAWIQFGVWQDLNQNGSSDAGEFRSFDQLGITSINLIRSGEQESVNGSVVLGRSSFTWSDGRTGEVADVALGYLSGSDTEVALIGVAPV